MLINILYSHLALWTDYFRPADGGKRDKIQVVRHSGPTGKCTLTSRESVLGIIEPAGHRAVELDGRRTFLGVNFNLGVNVTIRGFGAATESGCD